MRMHRSSLLTILLILTLLATNFPTSASFALRGARGAGTASNATMTYANALPGVDVAYTSENDVFKETITFAGPSAANTFSFDIQTSSGLTASTDAAGQTTLRATNGSAPF